MTGSATVDVVVVGGGIGGSALAGALAADGLEVVVLEATEEYPDRVRGESLLPWGVREAQDLGLEPALIDAGAHRTATWVHYDETIPAEVAEANLIPVGAALPGVAGALNLGHPRACATLATVATGAGAEIKRGVRDVTVMPGDAPVVRYRTTGDGAADAELRARLVVGADGRRSTVRNQAGIVLSRDPEAHMIAGLLLDDVEVSDEHDFLAGEGDLFMAAFHQGGGRLRVYLCYDIDDRHRYSGGDAVPRYLQDCAFACLPFGDRLAKARPAGPLGAHPGFDTWCERPYGPGVVLVGDAAGFSNPVIGQGLSVALRDARLVRDVIRGGDLSPTAFEPYAAERNERMRRLRATARFMSTGFGLGRGPGVQPADRRARYFELQRREPLVGALLASLFGGPNIGPPEAFDGRLVRALVS